MEQALAAVQTAVDPVAILLLETKHESRDRLNETAIGHIQISQNAFNGFKHRFDIVCLRNGL